MGHDIFVCVWLCVWVSFRACFHIPRGTKNRDRCADLSTSQVGKSGDFRVCAYVHKRLPEKNGESFPCGGKPPMSDVSVIYLTNLWKHKLARVELVDPQFLDISSFRNLWIHNVVIVEFVYPQVGET